MRSGDAKICPRCGKVKLLSDFRDKSLVTGSGRFCLKCKSNASAIEYIRTSSGRRPKLESEPSRSDMNKLRSFSENPSRYARGGIKAREKVNYLDNIKDKFSEGQLSTYLTALKEYDSKIIEKKEASSSKTDYNSTLLYAVNCHKSVKIRYKGSWRTIDPYSVNQTYVVAYCHFANDIRTFRIDRIQDAEIAGDFIFDKSIQAKTQSRIDEAPSYRRYSR